MTEPKPVAWRTRKIGDGYAYRAAQHGNNAEPLYPASSIAELQAQIAERDAEIARLRGIVQQYIDDFPAASFLRACEERFGYTPADLGQRLLELQDIEDRVPTLLERDAEIARLLRIVAAADRLDADTMYKWAPEAKDAYHAARKEQP